MKKNSAPPASRPAALTIGCLALIVLIGLASYANSMHGAFLWDDSRLVEENAFIRYPSHIPQILMKPMRAGAGGTEGDFYRPIQVLSYLWDYTFWKLNPTGYHLTNTLLHVLAACAVFWLILLLYQDRLLALLTSLLYVTYPIHTEAVSYVSGRADPLVAVFIFLSLVFYIKHLKSGGPPALILAVACAAGALLSKEYALILPALILLYHYSFKTRMRRAPFLAIVLTVAAYLIFRTAVVRPDAPSPEYPQPPFNMRFPGIFIALTQYLRLLVLPHPLHMEYGGILFSPTHPLFWLGLVLFGALVYTAHRMRAQKQWLSFSIYWFLVALIPNSNLYTLNAYMAEHWLYLPALGFCLLEAKLLTGLSRRPGFKMAAAGLSVLLISAYLTLTVLQNRHWQSPQALYEHTLKFAPDSSRLHSNLGIIYHQIGRREEALELFKKALELDPENWKAYANLGNAYRAAGRHEDAIRLHQRLIQQRPDDAGSYNNLGTIYFDLGRLDEAERCFKKALELYPYHATAINNLGLIAHHEGRTQEAEAYFKMAIELNPNYAEAHFMLGAIYYNRQDMAQAMRHADLAAQYGYGDTKLLEALKPYRR